MKKLNESDIEKYLVRKVKELGGRAYKWVSPGNIGVPDRIVCLPEGVLCFVELKAPGKKPTANQTVQLNRLDRLGFPTVVIDSKEGVDVLLELMA